MNRSTDDLLGEGSEKNLEILEETKVTLSWLMNSNMVKTEKFDHLHLAYQFKVLLSLTWWKSNLGKRS